MINIKRYFNIGIVVSFCILILSSYILFKRNSSLKEELSVAIKNEKAYSQENSYLKDRSRVFELTISQLEYFNDSILMEMDSIRKDLGIKDKNLKQLQYLLSVNKKEDTIIFKDTLFRDTKLDIDTTMRDSWYSIDLNLKYPSTITISPRFINEYYIVTAYKKETIKPPKKCKILRWFQRKHKVLEVQVINNNPYSTNKKQKFVEIVE